MEKQCMLVVHQIGKKRYSHILAHLDSSIEIKLNMLLTMRDSPSHFHGGSTAVQLFP